MSATGVQAQVVPPKTTAAKDKKPRTKPTHPPTAEMVNAAIKNLKERGGSSLQAIKKYIASTYKCDVEKQASFIRKYLKSAVTSGALVQTKGKGAAGSFKLSVKAAEGAVKKPKAKTTKTVVKKPATVKKTSAASKTAKKSASNKKAAASKAKKSDAKKVAAKPPKAKSAKSSALKSKVIKGSPKKIKTAAPKKKISVKKTAAPKKVAAKK